MNKKALITGITGQDGYHLTKLLLEKDYEVHGLHRRKAIFSLGHLSKLPRCNEIIWHSGDLTDTNCINDLFRKNKFDEVYHLGAQTFVKESFNNPEHTIMVNTLGTLNILSGIRMFQSDTKLYNAATSEMFGNSPMPEAGYNIHSEMMPASPYGVSKHAAYELCKVYRKSYNLFICNGVLFNHESAERGDEFVTQKIVKGTVDAFRTIDTDDFQPLVLGNLEACRDWGFAEDYVRAMWLMLQQDVPRDYVVATGETISVREFCELVIANINERRIFDKHLNLEDIVVTNDDHKRPLEVDYLRGDPWFTTEELGWKPEVNIEGLIELMIDGYITRVDLPGRR